jgi:hypothetical protein
MENVALDKRLSVAINQHQQQHLLSISFKMQAKTPVE